MSVQEPRTSSGNMTNPSNPYEGRWRWWYSSIADWMIRNPGGHLKDCAAELRKSENTIYYITSTDLFKDYFAQRRAEWQKDHDFTIRSRLTDVAEKALDAISEKLDKQRDKVELPLLTELLTSSLDRLGFAPATGPMVQVNQYNQDNSQKVVQLPGSVTATALDEARMALRAAQSQRLSPSPQSVLGAGKGAEPPLTLELEAEPEETSRADPSVDS